MLYIDYTGHMLKRNDMLPIMRKRRYITKLIQLFLFNFLMRPLTSKIMYYGLHYTLKTVLAKDMKS